MSQMTTPSGADVDVLASLKRIASVESPLYTAVAALIARNAELEARETYLLAALEQYPNKYPQRTQAAKICAGVLKLAREMVMKTENGNVE